MLDLEFPFTARDSPELRARVRRDLERAWRDVRAADPSAETLVLTGGFSRGEGSAIGARPLNDYDLVVFRARPWPPARATYARLRERLSRDLGLHVDLHPVWRGRARTLAAKVFWFDTKHGGRVLAGDPRALERIPVSGANELPPSEGARLLANRAVGLLEALPGEREPDALLARVQSAKGVLAACEAELVVAGRYHHSLRERRDRLLALAKEEDVAEPLLREIDWASTFKLDPEGPASARPPGDAWRAAREALLATAERVFPRAGWGELATYPREAPVSAADLAYALLARSPTRTLRPSHETRAVGLRLLARATWPGGVRVDAQSARFLAPFGDVDVGAWPDALARLAAARARTLH